MRIKTLSEKSTEEIIPVSFDFSKLTGLIDSASVTIDVKFGTDASSQDIIFGVPFINKGVVTQLITGGIDNVVYGIKMTILIDSAKYSLKAYLPVRNL